MEEKLQQLSAGKALLIGLGVALFYYFVMYDSGEVLQNNINNVQATLQQQRAELQGMKSEIAEAQKIEDEVRKLNEEMNMVKQAAPENYSSLELMKVLSSEAKIVGANIVSLTAASSQNQQNTEAQVFVPVAVSLELEATFNQLMLFLSNLTKISRLIVPDKLEFVLKNPSTALETASPTLAFKADFRAYRYNPTGAKASGQ